jgi:hypothetical protein
MDPLPTTNRMASLAPEVVAASALVELDIGPVL